MSYFLKTYVAVSTTIIFSTLIYKNLNFLISQTTNQNHLTSFEYQYLEDFDKDKFNKWKINYSLYKKHITKNISSFKDVKDEIQGAFLLKKWCADRINKKLNKEDFKLIKKYCVVNLKHIVLQEPNQKAIDDFKTSERKKLFSNKKKICNLEVGNLLDWCNSNFRLAHIPKNHGIINKVKSCCLITI